MKSSFSSSNVSDGEDSMSQSSTSTAGPPPDSPMKTGRFPRNSWAFASTQQDGNANDGSSLRSSRTLVLNQTGSFRPIQSGNNTGSFPINRGVHNRSLSGQSNASLSVSPNLGSYQPPEWANSFRLFNTRQISNSRQRDGGGSMYRSVLHNVSARGSMALDNDRSFLGSSICHQRQGSLFSSTFNGNGTFCASNYPLELKASAIFSAGSPLPSAAGAHNSSSPNTSVTHASVSGAVTPRTFQVLSTSFNLADYAMGGAKALMENLNTSQREINIYMNMLRANLAASGKTIMVGDEVHPLEIKRGSMIGYGGFARVYVGLNTMKGELVAIKEVNIAEVDDVEALNAIEQEFALLRSLQHPNIVKYSFFEHSKSKKVCRIVMEFLAGDSTLHLLQKFGPLTEAILRKLARDLLHAVAFIHKEGIFHRDIKPANILVSHRGVVKLCDFGCSKRVTELNKASRCIIGTPAYMAPEFIKGEGDHKADIWAVACTLFELGTGLLPWYHSGVKDHLPLMFYITTTSETPLVLPAQDNISDFSPEFMDFMEQCFIRDTQRRPEASDLLKHPWISGQKLPAKQKAPALLAYIHNDLGFFNQNGTGNNRSQDFTDTRPISDTDSVNSRRSALSPPPETNLSVYEEAACQQELELVAATIAVDLCLALATSTDGYRSTDRRLLTVGNSPVDTGPQLTRTSSTPSPSCSHRGPATSSQGDIASLNVSPEHSMVHDNFYFSQASLGASAGNFVLPLDAAPVPQQQYLRVNEEGNLDFVDLPDEDAELFGDSSHNKSASEDGSSMAPIGAVVGNGSGLVPGAPGVGIASGGHVFPSVRNSSFSRGSFSPASASDRITSPQRATSSQASRMESPYRGTIPMPPQAPRHSVTGTSPPLAPALARLSRSASQCSSGHGELAPLSPTSISTQKSTQSLLDRAKPSADGKLHMSFAVNTAPGKEVNVDLNVDVNDIHCRMVDNQPNYVVAMSSDIRDQITSKLKEVAAQSENTSPSMSPSKPAQSGAPTSPFLPSTGNHFYNSPSYYAASRSPARHGTRHSVGGASNASNGAGAGGGIGSGGGLAAFPPTSFYDSNSSVPSGCSTPANSAAHSPRSSSIRKR